MKGKNTRTHEKRVIIVNDGLGPNLGDQAILHSMLALFQTALPGTRFQVFPNSDMRSVSEYIRFWRALKRCDLLIFGGGQEIQDHASVAFLISGLLKLVLAKFARIPVVCYAIGVGPLGTKIGRFLTRKVLNRVFSISVRDEGSKRLLSATGITRVPVEITADPGIILEPKKPKLKMEWPQGSGPKVIIAPRRWYLYKHYLLPLQLRSRVLPWQGGQQFERIKQELAGAADDMIRQLGARIVFCPMRCAGDSFNPGQDDDHVCQEILALMSAKEQVRVWNQAGSPAELKNALGEADVVVGMRMHSLIFASMMQVPIVGITILPKHTAFLLQVGQEAFGIDPDFCTRTAVTEAVSKAIHNRDYIASRLNQEQNRLYTLIKHDVDRIVMLLEKMERG